MTVKRSLAVCMFTCSQGRSQTQNLWGQKFPKLIVFIFMKLIGCSLDQINVKYKVLNHMLLILDDLKYKYLKFTNQRRFLVSNARRSFCLYHHPFDKVPHQRTLLKLEQTGMRGNVLGWIECFLTKRSLRKWCLSRVISQEEVSVSSGVPVLYYTLFLRTIL